MEYLSGLDIHQLDNTRSPSSNIITFALLLNIKFWNYYELSCTYARESPFNHLDSTSSESTLPCILAHNCHLYCQFFRQENKVNVAKIPLALSTPQPAHPRYIVPPPPPTPTYPPLSWASHCAAPFRITTHGWRNVSLRFSKSFLRALTLLFPWYCLDGRGRLT